MDFIGINQFGALTSKIGKVINFEDLDLDGDGKISEEEFNSSIFNKDGGFDTVEFTTVDKNNNKEITQEEFDIFEQERLMEELVSELYGQIATDFIGSNAQLAPEVKNALKDLIKDFSEEYQQSGQKIKNMAASFREVLPAKYEEIKADILGETNNTKTESFWDVKKELDENVPDRTTTRSEKALAIEYIDRMLACDDIPEDAKTFWTNQRAVIVEEMKHCLPDDALKIAKEWKEFTDKYWRDGWFPTVDARIQYFEKYIDYMNQILACEDVPEEYRKEYTRMKQNATRDLNNTLTENEETEKSYYTVFQRYKKEFPDVNNINSLEEKELAISYIELMLACKDVPSNVTSAWSTALEIFKREARELRAEQENRFR